MDLCVAIFHGHFQYNWVVGALAIVGHGGPWWAMVGKDLLLGSPSQDYLQVPMEIGKNYP